MGRARPHRRIGRAGRAPPSRRSAWAPRPTSRIRRRPLFIPFCTEVLTTREAGDETYRAALDLLGDAGLIDLVGLRGYYCLVSFTLNVFRIEPPGGPPSFA